MSLPIAHVVGRDPTLRRDATGRGSDLEPAGFSFPNEQAVIGGAVAAGLWLSGARLIASLATVTAMLMAFAVVYTGVAYPGDALAGLLLGALVVLALYPFAIGSFREAVHAIARSPLRVLVGGAHHSRPVGPGPAARPEPIGESGAVRILPPNESRKRQAEAECLAEVTVKLVIEFASARSSRHAGVAQMEAQATCNRQVVGSSPTTGSFIHSCTPSGESG